jgi:hypothetical protein
MDLLIKHVRDIEEQIQHNAKQPIYDIEKLILDCQVSYMFYRRHPKLLFQSFFLSIRMVYVI